MEHLVATRPYIDMDNSETRTFSTRSKVKYNTIHFMVNNINRSKLIFLFEKIFLRYSKKEKEQNLKDLYQRYNHIKNNIVIFISFHPPKNYDLSTKPSIVTRTNCRIM